MSRKGLTLVELMAGLAVFTVILAAAVAAFQGGMRVYHEMNNDATLTQESTAAEAGRGTMRGLVADLQQAQRPLATSASQLQILVLGTTVTYELAGGELRRGVAPSTVTAASHVESAQFAYYEPAASGALQASTTPANVALILAKLRFTRKNRSVYVNASGTLRNR